MLVEGIAACGQCLSGFYCSPASIIEFKNVMQQASFVITACRRHLEGTALHITNSVLTTIERIVTNHTVIIIYRVI